ncbi:MAG: hypothetical protein ACMG6E_07760 [Candidatus Roizmanbacteria bacterium]
MSVPMIKALKGGNAFVFLHADFFKVILDILVYSFGDDQKSFDEILSKLDSFFRNFYEHINRTCFINLLDSLVQRMASYDLKWFKNQHDVNGFLFGCMLMVEENKVPGTFTKKLCNSLLDHSSKPEDYLSRPS